MSATKDEPARQPSGNSGNLMLGLIFGLAAIVLGFYLTRVVRNVSQLPAPSAAPADQGPFLPLDALVIVEAGTLTHGGPETAVQVPSFEMDVTEVTVAAYQSCLEAGKCTPAGTGGACNWNKLGRDRHPINCVDWGQAAAYCAFVKKRLPTEQEWEYVARGKDGQTYPWKDGPPASNLCWNGEGNDLGAGHRQGTCPVGRFPAGASPFGALDMAGNVREWTATPYCPLFGETGCNSDRKVIRGGGWNNVKSEDVRAQDRSHDEVKARNDDVGFRCARERK